MRSATWNSAGDVTPEIPMIQVREVDQHNGCTSNNHNFLRGLNTKWICRKVEEQQVLLLLVSFLGSSLQL